MDGVRGFRITTENGADQPVPLEIDGVEGVLKELDKEVEFGILLETTFEISTEALALRVGSFGEEEGVQFGHGDLEVRVVTSIPILRLPATVASNTDLPDLPRRVEQRQRRRLGRLGEDHPRAVRDRQDQSVPLDFREGGGVLDPHR